MECEVELQRRRDGRFETLRSRVPAGTLLVDAVVAAGLPIARGCSRNALCGRCGVQVLAGAEELSPEQADERAAKERNRIAPELRLACRARVQGPVRVTAGYW